GSGGGGAGVVSGPAEVGGGMFIVGGGGRAAATAVAQAFHAAAAVGEQRALEVGMTGLEIARRDRSGRIAVDDVLVVVLVRGLMLTVHRIAHDLLIRDVHGLLVLVADLRPVGVHRISRLVAGVIRLPGVE